MSNLRKNLIRLGTACPELRPHLRAILAQIDEEDLDLTPPKGVQEAAQQGQDYRKEYGRGGTPVAFARARDLSNGIRVSLETVERMKAFFDRHEKNRVPPTQKTQPDGGPTNGWIAWQLWGGDAGRRWAEKIIKQHNRSE